MKPVIAPYARPLYAMRIECRNGAIIRVVEYPYDVEMGGVWYRADTGFQFSGVESGTNFSPGVVDLTSFLGVSPEITLASIQSGIFDKAMVYLFCTDWANPVEDEEAIAKLLFGKTSISDNKYTTECMTLIDLLNASVGEGHSATCTLVFGGQEYGGCKVDLAPLTVTGSVTSVTNGYVFADSARAEVDDYFGAGSVWFTTGPNAGVPPQRVKSYTAAGGIITVTEPFPFPPQLGDLYTMIPGCRKRLQDCRDKWDNVARRRGFDFVPGSRMLNKVGSGGPQ
jgi:uncharacterized phage protein (TIGR02218 family)